MALTETLTRGILGIEDRGSNFHPDEWDSKLKTIRLRMAKKSALIAFMSGIPSEPAESHHFHWPVEEMATKYGTLTDVYDSAGSSYSSGGVAGTQLQLVCAEATAKKALAGDTILVINRTTRARRHLVARSVVLNGSASYIAAELRETDTSNALAGSSLVFICMGQVIGQTEGLPGSIYNEATWFDNYTEPFGESSEVTAREMKEADRIDPNIRMRKRKQALDAFYSKQGYSFMFGMMDKFKGPDGKDTTTTDGIVTMLAKNESGNCFDWTSNATYSGQTFRQGGLKWMRTLAEQIGRKAQSNEKVVITSSWAINEINEAVAYEGSYQLAPMSTSFGLKVTKLVMPSQDWIFVEDPLFTDFAEFRDCAFAYEPQLVQKKVLLPFEFIDDDFNKAGGKEYRKYIKEGYVEDCGLKAWNFEAMGWLTGIGATNTA